MALMGGFARIGNNEITFLVNDAVKSSDIDPQEAQNVLVNYGQYWVYKQLFQIQRLIVLWQLYVRKSLVFLG
ncbi:hypothetical protein M8C21_005957 [Ambrosia artemisiifolia]|uniref:Uncharacterized protein n=1 Tax=Ambrosia artemisiifolia TaxID=4212 RepID=A0AAD5C1L8_AMBAR|nr:hypothetical protein M8C21_005957 [Ambrosia artemisiifolia]